MGLGILEKYPICSFKIMPDVHINLDIGWYNVLFYDKQCKLSWIYYKT